MENPFVVPVTPRFRDIDTMGHVNNAVYATYLEEARTAFYDSVLGVSLTDVPTVLASLEIEYRSSIEIDDDVRVELRVGDLGGSSLPMTYEIYADGDLAAAAETVQVVVDPDTGSSASIPDDWRTSIETHREERS